MKLAALTVLLALSNLAGCAYDPIVAEAVAFPPVADDRVVRVSGGFSDAEFAAIGEAVAGWNALGAGAPDYAPLSVERLAGPADPAASFRTVNRVTGAELMGNTLWTTYSPTSSRVEIRINGESTAAAAPTALRAIAAHELGHSLLLGHVEGNPESLMAPIVPSWLSCGSTAEDRAEFCRHYSCAAENLPRCD